jgi:hypothetical protein
VQGYWPTGPLCGLDEADPLWPELFTELLPDWAAPVGPVSPDWVLPSVLALPDVFFSPNQMAIMNSLPPDQRGAGAGMNATFMNSAQVLSIGIFFSIITLGLAASLPGNLYHGLVAQVVPTAQALKLSHLPPIGSLFAAFLGFNPIQTEVPHQVLVNLGHARASYLTGRSFFPKLISPSFADGLHLAFDFAAATSFIAAIASWLRGGKYIHLTESLSEEVGTGLTEVGELAAAEVGAGVMIDD